MRREGDDTAYELEAYSGIEGNKLQRCVAELDFPKFGMEEFFAEYDIKIGSRVYADEQTTDFTQKATAEESKEFTEPHYDDEIIDEIEARENVHYEYLLFKSFDSDAGTAFTGSATGEVMTSTIDMYRIISPDEDQDQILEIVLETSVPLAYGQDAEGQVVVNKLSLTNLDAENPDESRANIVCRTTIGDTYARVVEQYPSEVDFENFDGFSTTTMEPLDPIYAVFSASKDYEMYETYDNEVDTAYARCTVQIVMNEQNREEIGQIFNARYEGVYSIALAEEVEDTTTGTWSWSTNALTSGTFKVFLAEPVYDDSYDETFSDQVVTEQSFELDVSADASAVGGF